MRSHCVPPKISRQKRRQAGGQASQCRRQRERERERDREESPVCECTVHESSVQQRLRYGGERGGRVRGVVVDSRETIRAVVRDGREGEKDEEREREAHLRAW